MKSKTLGKQGTKLLEVIEKLISESWDEPSEVQKLFKLKGEVIESFIRNKKD